MFSTTYSEWTCYQAAQHRYHRARWQNQGTLWTATTGRSRRGGWMVGAAGSTPGRAECGAAEGMLAGWGARPPRRAIGGGGCIGGTPVLPPPHPALHGVSLKKNFTGMGE